jgi:hypothetical protein
MQDHSQLYEISLFRRPFSPVGSASSHGERTYAGQLVFAGPDAAIEIAGNRVSGYVRGKPSHPQGQLAELIGRYREAILNGADDLRESDTKTVILAGRWHHVEPEMEPRFEAYLVHLVARDGTVTTKRYEAEIFGWDYPGDGGGFGIYLNGDPAGDFEGCVAATRQHLKRGGGEAFRSKTGLRSVDAILWYPEDDKSLPMIFSSDDRNDFVDSVGEDYSANAAAIATTDGTLASALEAVSRRVISAPGELKGLAVDRARNRPEQLTLHEVFSSTDAPGYWIQTREGQSEPYSSFILPIEPSEWGDVILEKSNAPDEHSLGCMYASDWRSDGSADTDGVGGEDTFRLLAVGGAPRLPHQPL